MEYRSKLSRARGLGSAHHGADHWWIKGLTSIALVPLFAWFITVNLLLLGVGYEATRDWLSSTFNSTMMILFIAVTFYHAKLGLHSVIQDYIHEGWIKLTVKLAVSFTLTASGLAAVLSVLKVYFGG